MTLERQGAGNVAIEEANMRQRVGRGLLGYLAFAAFWFGLAGRLTWWRGWAFVLLFLGYVGLMSWRLWRVAPGLVRERNQPAEKAESWDRVIVPLYTAVLMVQLGVAALDSGRFGWSAVPLPVQVLGWGLLISAGGLIWHVMMTNAYLSSWARLQLDRGQQVVDHGAYAYIRHPMYLAIIVAFLGLPFALNSWWAALLSPLIAGLFVIRTSLEDRMLKRGLAGYLAYAKRVRFRLVPGIW